MNAVEQDPSRTPDEATSPPVGTSDSPDARTTRHTLSTGEAVLLRDVTPADRPLLLGLLEHVTGDARWFRFFTGGADIERVATAEARCDGDRRTGVLVLSGDGLEVLGHGMCVPASDTQAEIAFEVADGHHRRGIGTIMLAHLIGQARTAGYETLVAEVLPSNKDMLDLLGDSGNELRSSTADGIRSVVIPLRDVPVDRPATS